MGNARILTDDNFENEINEGTVLVDFYADWCGPCNAVAPLISQLASDETFPAKVVKLNVDESPQTAQKFGIRAIPTFVVFKDGKEFSRTMGINPSKDFYLKLVTE